MTTTEGEAGMTTTEGEAGMTAPGDPRAKDAFVAVQMLVMEPVTEHVRCTRLATGQVVYDFWTDGRRVARIDANAYDFALDQAREKTQDEQAPPPARVRAAARHDRG